MKRGIILFMQVIILALFGVVVVQGQEDFPTDDDVNTIAKKLYCPVCPNTPLDVCETVACQDWREEIKMQLSNGWSEEEIVAYFADQYGERVLAEPERRGFTSLVWILPVVAVLLGAVMVGQVLKSWRTDRQAPPIPTWLNADVSPEVLAQIENELNDLI